MTRTLPLLALAGALLIAPFQCGKKPDPSLRREDSPGDALYGLAERFRKDGNPAAEQATLRYLVDQYPKSRHVPAAVERLGDAGAPDASR